MRYNERWPGRRHWIRDDLIATLVSPPYREFFEQAPLRSLQEFFAAQLTDEPFERKAYIANLFQRQRRFVVFQIDSLARTCDLILPFYDHRVLKAFTTLPLSRLCGQAAYRRMITRFFPKLAQVPDVRSLRPVSSQNRTSNAIPLPARLSNWLWKHTPAGIRWRLAAIFPPPAQIVAKLTGGWYGAHNRRHYVHQDSLMEHYHYFYDRAFQYNHLLEPYFEVAAIRRELAKHRRGQNNTDPYLYNLWTLACWKGYIHSPMHYEEMFSNPRQSESA